MDDCLIRTLTADIEPSAKILAAMLYAHAPIAGALPVSEILSSMGIRTPGALRHLRSQLATAAIVATTVTDGSLSWRFLSASQPRAARPTDALTDSERVPQTRSTTASASQPRAARPTDALTDSERVPQTRSTTASASQPRAARPTDALIPPQTPPGRQVGINILTTGTNLPTPLPPTAPDEQARSIRLLRAISINAKLATQIAARWNFRDVCGFVAVYLADHAAGKCNGAGVLQSRCLDPDSAAPQLTAHAPELSGVLLSQHITPADRAAWSAADAAAQRQTEYERFSAAAKLYAESANDRFEASDPDPAPDRRPAELTELLQKRIPKLGPITAELCDEYVNLHVPDPADRARIAEHHTLVGNLALRILGTRTFQVEAV